MSFTYERRYRGPLRAVIVDWAGTIVDFGSCAPVFAFRGAFRDEGVEITAAEAREPMGFAKRDHIRAITRMPRVAAAFRDARGRDFTDDDVTRIYERFLPLQLAVLEAHGGVIPGAIEAFAAFRARGLAIGSSTGYTRELMDVVLPVAKRQGLEPDAMVCASDVPAGRPSPYMCFVNAMRLGVTCLGAAVKIGDTVADVEEGLNAGMWTIGLSRTGNEVGLTERELDALPAEDQARRIDAAARLLLESDRTVADIAVECGYCDHSAFTRQFRSATSLTPTEYRRARAAWDRSENFPRRAP